MKESRKFFGDKTEYTSTTPRKSDHCLSFYPGAFIIFDLKHNFDCFKSEVYFSVHLKFFSSS